MRPDRHHYESFFEDAFGRDFEDFDDEFDEDFEPEAEDEWDRLDLAEMEHPPDSFD